MRRPGPHVLPTPLLTAATRRGKRLPGAEGPPEGKLPGSSGLYFERSDIFIVELLSKCTPFLWVYRYVRVDGGPASADAQDALPQELGRSARPPATGTLCLCASDKPRLAGEFSAHEPVEVDEKTAQNDKGGPCHGEGRKGAPCHACPPTPYESCCAAQRWWLRCLER